MGLWLSTDLHLHGAEPHKERTVTGAGYPTERIVVSPASQMDKSPNTWGIKGEYQENHALVVEFIES